LFYELARRLKVERVELATGVCTRPSVQETVSVEGEEREREGESSLLAERVLARVGDVEETILVLVLGVDVRHEFGCSTEEGRRLEETKQQNQKGLTGVNPQKEGGEGSNTYQ
jgi:hypothetical protein